MRRTPYLNNLFEIQVWLVIKMWSVKGLALNLRGVAQSGSAPALGAGGPQFESGRPDYNNSSSTKGLDPLVDFFIQLIG